jgi:hypothetical protein
MKDLMGCELDATGERGKIEGQGRRGFSQHLGRAPPMLCKALPSSDFIQFGKILLMEHPELCPIFGKSKASESPWGL